MSNRNEWRPWLSSVLHEDNCRCERCKLLQVNFYAPKSNDKKGVNGNG